MQTTSLLARSSALILVLGALVLPAGGQSQELSEDDNPVGLPAKEAWAQCVPSVVELNRYSKQNLMALAKWREREWNNYHFDYHIAGNNGGSGSVVVRHEFGKVPKGSAFARLFGTMRPVEQIHMHIQEQLSRAATIALSRRNPVVGELANCWEFNYHSTLGYPVRYYQWISSPNVSVSDGDFGVSITRMVSDECPSTGQFLERFTSHDPVEAARAAVGNRDLTCRRPSVNDAAVVTTSRVSCATLPKQTMVEEREPARLSRCSD